jgi:uncharacterized membrane protein (UPF0182 family)
MRRHPVGVIVLAAALFLFFAGPSLISFYTDWLWFLDVGYQRVYLTTLKAQGTLFSTVLSVTMVWLALNFRLALAAIGDARPMLMTRQGVEVALPGRRQLQALANVAALIVAVLVGLFAAAEWEVWMAWRYAVPFGQVDPILGFDVGFYVFTLPFLQFVHGLAQALIIIAALACGGIYLISGNLTSGFPTQIRMSGGARRHLAVLAALFFATLALGAWMNRAEYLVQPSGLIHGASYADVHARIPAALALSVVAGVGVILSAYHAYARAGWPLVSAVALYLAVAAGGSGYATFVQRFLVTPNEQVRETPFIQHNIEATRKAYDLAGVTERSLSGDAELTRADLERNRSTLQNIRLWDHQPLRETFSQLQEIRTYYDFVQIDNDRYHLNGQLRQVMLSARELNSASLQNRTWVNERLTFTHGYGLTLGPVNQVTSEGLPVLYIRNMPPETEAGLNIDEPSLYFSELSNDYVIVHTKTPEFHYPSGDDNVTTQYAGAAGVRLSSWFRKLAFALRFRAYQILLSDDIQPESRILFDRNIATRALKIAPFLTFDRDPYPVLAEGHVYWMVDAYTTSDLYPYSTLNNAVLRSGTNYIRNSVKFVINAYDGTTTAYLADETDPIAKTYARIFPSLFKPLSAMPPALREHIRYPEDLFAIQASVFATYHMTQPAVFYNREDQWQIPAIEENGGEVAMQPYYTVMRLPGEQEAEFIQMLPFTPRRRDNLAAWLVARSDPEHYGKLEVFEFPKQKLVFGPRQVVARINQDQTISPVITLWNQQGSQVLWGTLMVIPIEESLLYVRPLYLRGQGGRIPELRRVVVAYQNQIVMEPTLDAALGRLFGGSAATPADAQTTRSSPGAGAAPQSAQSPQPAQGAQTAPDITALTAEARTHYDKAIDAQRAGDWARYGEEIRLLGEVLKRLPAR